MGKLSRQIWRYLLPRPGESSTSLLTVALLHGSLISGFHAPSHHSNEIYLGCYEQLCISFKRSESTVNDKYTSIYTHASVTVLLMMVYFNLITKVPFLLSMDWICWIQFKVDNNCSTAFCLNWISGRGLNTLRFSASGKQKKPWWGGENKEQKKERDKTQLHLFSYVKHCQRRWRKRGSRVWVE